MAYFGFVPSHDLILKIQTLISKKNSSEKLYEYRDEIALMINQEIIDALLTNVVKDFPQNDKKETAEKLAKFIQSSVAVLLKQLLGKASNTTVQQSIAFSKKSLFKTKNQDYVVGEILDQPIVINLKQHFAQLKAGEKTNLTLLAEDYKLFADETIRHFMHDFYQTLDLGMIKRKTADIGCTATTKAVRIAIDKIIPHLNKEELKVLAIHHDQLFFQ